MYQCQMCLCIVPIPMIQETNIWCGMWKKVEFCRASTLTVVEDLITRYNVNGNILANFNLNLIKEISFNIVCL